jgi:preprotein translocase subunit SecY
MIEKLRTVFSIPELRNKILLTLGLLAIYRVGYQIRLPMTIPSDAASGSGLNEFLAKVSVFAATDLRQSTIFGLGIMPYISASIVFQLLGTVWPPIMALRKEGQAGQRRINELTRYLTVFLCLIQSFLFLKYSIMGGDQIAPEFIDPATGSLHWGWQITAVMIMTCGTVFLMWLGEQIDEYGIGNGISLLIMAGIVAAMPKALMDIRNNMTTQLSGSGGEVGPDKLLVLGALFIAVVFGVVFITMGQRRIQTQSAKHVRGRKVYGGTKQFLPLRINQAGVMPIIFASSLLLLPGMLFGVIGNWLASSDPQSQNTFAKIFAGLSDSFVGGSSLTYVVLYVLLIFFFCYFWTSITFNPKEMSENLKDHGTFIPGYRPGKRTADYLEKVMLRVTYVGAAFLALVAIVPVVVQSQLGVSFTVANFYGGTGLLIAVSVAFDLVQKIDNHLLMRNYKGLLES